MNLLRSLAAGAAVWAAEMAGGFAGGFAALGGKLNDYSDSLGPFLVGLCCGAVIAVALHLFWVRPVARTILQRAHRFVRTTELGSYGDIQGAKYEIRRLIRWFFRGAAALQVGLVLAATILTLSQGSGQGGGSIAAAAFGTSAFALLVPIFRGLGQIPVLRKPMALVGLAGVLLSAILGMLSPIAGLPYGLGFGAGSLTLTFGFAGVLYKATELAELGILAPWPKNDTT